MQRLFAFLQKSKRQYGSVTQLVRALDYKNTHSTWDINDSGIDGLSDNHGLDAIKTHSQYVLDRILGNSDELSH